MKEDKAKKLGKLMMAVQFVQDSADVLVHFPALWRRRPKYIIQKFKDEMDAIEGGFCNRLDATGKDGVAEAYDQMAVGSSILSRMLDALWVVKPADQEQFNEDFDELMKKYEKP